MASKRFLMVPDDSSAARRPLPGVTMATATLLRSVRFIRTSSGSCPLLAAKIDRSRAKEEVNVGRRKGGALAYPSPLRGPRRAKLALEVGERERAGVGVQKRLLLPARPRRYWRPHLTVASRRPPSPRVPRGRDKKRRSRHFRIELALGVAFGHLGGRQDLLDLARLACGVELLEPLLAQLGHRVHRGLEVLARIEFLRIVLQNFPNLSGHR